MSAPVARGEEDAGRDDDRGRRAFMVPIEAMP